jgi:predicted transcriptional regulator of viral defense system
VPKLEEALRGIAAEHEGLFTSSEAAEAGISPALVVQLKNRGRLERLARLYRFPAWPTTHLQHYHEAVLWPQAHRKLGYALISHESALELPC